MKKCFAVEENNSLHPLMLQSLHQKNVNERRLPENCRDRYVIRRLAKSSDGYHFYKSFDNSFLIIIYYL